MKQKRKKNEEKEQTNNNKQITGGMLCIYVETLYLILWVIGCTEI